jgi:hypothetical protein
MLLPWSLCKWFLASCPLSLPGITVRYNTTGDKSKNDDFLEFVIGDVLQDQVLAYTMLRINICILFRKCISLDGMHCN